MAEGMAAEGLINLEDIKVINVKPDAEFPYPYSTSIAAPEWPLASLRHISTVRPPPPLHPHPLRRMLLCTSFE